MKAQELMIGDWVMQFGKPRRIVGIRTDTFYPYIKTNMGDTWYEEGKKYLAKPIPLTQEILEKNGFEVSSEHARYYFEEEGEKYEFVLRKMYYINNPKVQKGWSFYAFNVLTLVDYVHELQHALRLCGIEKEIEI